MRSRKYTKRVEFWQTSNVPDGYGGNTVSEALLTSSWAEIKTAGNNSRYSQRLTDLGITDPTSALIIKLRHRNDIDYSAIDMYVKYRNLKYIIQNAPTNVNLEDVDVEIIAVRQSS